MNSYNARVSAQALDKKCRKVIDRAWEDHKFPKGIRIEDFDGWESAGGDRCMDFTRTFYYSRKGDPADKPTHKGIVHAYFSGNSHRPRHLTFRDCNGNGI